MAQKYYQSPRWSNEIADCSMPMTFDTYSNCSFGCLYCFSQFQRAIGGAKENYLHKEVNPVNAERIKRFYVSDAHFKELCCNGSCCGLPPDWNYSRGQWCEALQIAKNNPNGEVSYKDVCGDVNSLVGSFQWVRATGYNCNSSEKRAKYEGMTMADYMKWLWNNPQSGQSPYKLFEGALVPVLKDEEGNLIYKFNGAKF